jgi:aminoglycoside phosphotransferase
MVTADRLLAECRDQGLQLPEKGMCHCLVSSNRGSHGNDLLFLFQPGGARPCLVAKIARTEQNNRGLANEYRWLRRLQEQGLGLGLIPQTFFSSAWNGHTYFVQETVAGHGLGELLCNRRTNDEVISPVLRQALDFLVDLFQGRGKLVCDSRDETMRLFRSHLKALDAEPRQIRRIEAAASAVKLESCFCHGDYWATNLLVDPKRRWLEAVIDYEFAAACYTTFDIVWFVANLPLFVETFSGGDMAEGYRRTFFKPGGQIPLYRSLFESYFEKIGRSTPPLCDLFILGLLYASFREQQLFGRSMGVDGCCRQLLLHTIDGEANFAL